MTSVALLTVMWTTFIALAGLEIRRRSPALLFVAALVLAAGLSLSFYLFTNHYDRAIVVEAAMFICAFNLLYFATRFVLQGSRVVPDGIEGGTTPLSRGERRFLVVVGAIFLVPFFVTLARAGFSFRLLAASAWRENFGLSNLVMGYTAHASFGLVLCLFVLRRRALAAFALVATALLVVTVRSRALGLAAVAPVLLYMFFWALRGRFRPSRILLVCGAGLATLLGFFLVQQIRYLGPLTAAAAAHPDLVLQAAVDRIAALSGDFSLVNYFLWLLANGHQVEGFGQFVTAQRMVLFWLPPLKPPEFTHSLAAAVWGGGQGGSIHPTIYGLGWGEAKWFGLMYAPFVAVIFRILDGLIIRFRRRVTWAVLLGPYAVFAVLAARGALYNAWVVLLAAMLFLIGLIHLTSFRRHRLDATRGAPPAEAVWRPTDSHAEA